MLRNRFYFCRCFVAINGEVIYRCEVSVSDYILCIAWLCNRIFVSVAKTTFQTNINVPRWVCSEKWVFYERFGFDFFPMKMPRCSWVKYLTHKTYQRRWTNAQREHKERNSHKKWKGDTSWHITRHEDFVIWNFVSVHFGRGGEYSMR